MLFSQPIAPIRTLRSLAAALVLFSVPLTLSAHDLYLLPSSFHPQKNQRLRVAFHNGDSFPESEVAPKPERLVMPRIASQSAGEPVKNLRIAGKETLGETVAPQGGSLQLSVATIPNFIELAPDKFEAYLKEEGLNDVLAWRTEHRQTAMPGRERYTKFAKSLLQSAGSDDFYRHPLGLRIEIVPLANPYTLHPGGKLPVQVLFQGKPAANLQVEAARAGKAGSKTTVIGRTGADGRIEIPLDQSGPWRLHTLLMDHCAEPKVADWESSWASLTFEIQ